MKNKNLYGYVGWSEMLANRNELLNEYDNSLRKNQNRPLRTSHGISGEAAFRNKLIEYLPQKYGVTSGYIIPDIISNSYKIYHFDIIIYDKLNSPILWVDGSFDDSELGKNRAIPAKYIFSIIEVKSQFNASSIRQAVDKLSELTNIKSHFPREFTSSMFFFDIKNGLIKNTRLLNKIIAKPLFKFTGGIILRSELNIEMTGLIKFFEGNYDSNGDDTDGDLVKNIDEIKVYKSGPGQLTCEAGTTIKVSKELDGKWHFLKSHNSPIVSINNQTVFLNWSYGNYSEYIINLLSYLEGKRIDENNETFFGQVFENFDVKE